MSKSESTVDVAPEQADGRIVVDEAACNGCGVCLDSCPVDVFRLREHDGGKLVHVAYPDDCHECFLCELDCPTNALHINFAPRTHGFVSIYDEMMIPLPWPESPASRPVSHAADPILGADLAEVDGTDTDPPSTV